MLATGWETPTRSVAGPAADASTAVYSAQGISGGFTGNGESPFVRVAEAVKPVVVNITAEKTMTGHPQIPMEMFDWGPFFGEPQDRHRMPRCVGVSS